MVDSSWRLSTGPTEELVDVDAGPVVAPQPAQPPAAGAGKHALALEVAPRDEDDAGTRGLELQRGASRAAPVALRSPKLSPPLAWLLTPRWRGLATRECKPG